MAKLGAVDIPGNSGAFYKFIAYTLDTVFRRNRPAVYVVTRRREVSPGFKHHRIRVDQTDDLRQLLASSSMFSAIPGANCICVHAEQSAGARLAIQTDLRKS